jgi:hypothetical protein
VFALLKPIIEVPKIVVTLATLFKLVEITKTVVIIVRCCFIAKAVILLLDGIVGGFLRL